MDKVTLRYLFKDEDTSHISAVLNAYNKFEKGKPRLTWPITLFCTDDLNEAIQSKDDIIVLVSEQKRTLPEKITVTRAQDLEKCVSDQLLSLFSS